MYGRELQPAFQEQADRSSAQVAERDADGTAESGERDRLDQELDQHIVTACADRFTDANLARPLRDRHEHDVHNADAADEQRDPDYGAHDAGSRVEHRGDRLHQLFLRGDLEIVGLAFFQMVPSAQDVSDLLFGQVDVVARAHLQRDRQVLHAVGPVEHLRGGERDVDNIVRIVADRRAALLHHADDGEVVVIHADVFADRVAQPQLPCGLESEDGYAFLCFLIERAEEAAVIDELLGHVRIALVDSEK